MKLWCCSVYQFPVQLVNTDDTKKAEKKKKILFFAVSFCNSF